MRLHTVLGRCLVGTAVVAGGAGLVSSCSLIGLGIGAASDPGTDDRRIPGYQPQRVPVGSEVRVETYSNATISGKYMGMSRDARGNSVAGAIRIDTARGPTNVPTRDIASITIPGEHSGMLAGALVGLALDMAFILAVTSSTSSSRDKEPPPPKEDAGSGNFSCPLVYSFDGRVHHLDAEVFGGALFPSAQRTDWARLDHALDDGEVSVDVRGQPGERQYVDELTLVTVDHAAGTSVVPTRAGELREIRRPVAPRSAKGFRGLDLRDELERSDGVMWTSNPFGRRANVEEELRDFVELEFARPSGVVSATLVLRARNTQWGAYLQQQLMALQGSGQEGLARELDRSPPLRAAVHAAMVREGMLLVKLWRDGKWVSVDHVWEVGPAAARDVAVPLDLSAEQDDVLRIRLDSTVGIWSLDRAAVEFGEPTVVNGREVKPARAVDSAGRDRRGELARSDRRFFEMPRDEKVLLSFRTPPHRPTLRRSVFIKASGWYRILAEENAPGDPALIRRFITEPGAYGRFALRTLHDHSARLLR